MFLKSLEIQGFKSFADKVYFSFSPGVTAIVGPNGSGKSNVVDAIRWVLGEQSAKTLRGSKMEDVIFSGSVDRKPVGMARVTMILDNSQRIFALDCDEIEVSRTLYRSGESNYMLNKNTCRLKDIQELFMDTGLGKDGFSVIGQGKIEEILTLHAEERRGLIEEAAGISKYKYRKREAERKLESTTDDMTRLDDILYELEQRIDPLAKQAEKVRVYRSLKSEADHLQLSYLTQQLLAVQTEQKTQRETVESDHQAAVEAQTKLDRHEADLTVAKEKLAQERHEMEGAQAAYTDSLRDTQEHEKALTLLSERHQHAKERLTTLTTLVEDADRQLREITANAETLAIAVADSQQQVADIGDEAKHGENALHHAETTVASLKTQIDDLQSQQFDVLSRQSATNNEMTRLEQALHGDQARSERVDTRLEELQRQYDQLATETAAREADRVKQEKILTETETALQTLTSDISHCGQILQEQLRQQQQTVQHLMQSKSRLETLEEFEASGEGYYQGVQQVLRAKKENRLQGIQGSILQLLDIPSDYLTAIENALGGAAQNVVVTDDRDAQQAIAWLKRERRGRVTFMPLNLVKGKRQDVDFHDDAVIGLALDLVTYDPAFESVMAQLLGRVWILRDLASATALSKRTGSKYRFVTLDGDVIAPGGSMTGGHQKKQSSIVHRKHEMAELKDKITALTAEEAAFAVKIAELQQKLEALQQSQERGRSRQQEEQLQLREISVVLDQQTAQLKRLQRELTLEKMNRETLSAERETAEQELVRVRDVSQNIAEELTELAETLQHKRMALSTAEEALQTTQMALQNILVQQATSDEQYQHQRQRYREVVAEKTRLEQLQTQQNQDQTELIEEIRALDEALLSEKISLQTAQQSHQDVSEAMAAAKQKIDTMEVEIREQERLLSEIRSLNDKCWRSHNASEMRLERLNEQVTRFSDSLLEEFGFSPEAALAAADLACDISDAPSQLKTLRNKIARLGEINFTALEEYEHVSEQANFLKAQLEDLNLAKSKLEAVIHEMETTMSQRFKDAYEKVNEQFAQIFTAMFGGGSARLELSMPGRYLETGVEIVAQPPGKKERVLTLLSGGERALTAAALLFALLEVRPSPFVILDEIEAALDEANVDRFASFIKQYTNKTQFIIISHRKGTMEAATVLYGITMDANGVSKQVSVRLSDFNDEEVS
ncbi:MAG: chromosome segregation protein SMC [Peptococcaceae bacterium]|nr:chromosome segregation protein SMC [Peptococcaceae bacterium]